MWRWWCSAKNKCASQCSVDIWIIAWISHLYVYQLSSKDIGESVCQKQRVWKQRRDAYVEKSRIAWAHGTIDQIVLGQPGAIWSIYQVVPRQPSLVSGQLVSLQRWLAAGRYGLALHFQASRHRRDLSFASQYLDAKNIQAYFFGRGSGDFPASDFFSLFLFFFLEMYAVVESEPHLCLL